MEGNIHITPANQDDLATLVEIKRSATCEDIISRFYFNNSDDWTNPLLMRALVQVRLRSRFAEPSSQIFKAYCDDDRKGWWRLRKTSSRIVGVVCLTRQNKTSPEEANEQDERNRKYLSELPKQLNKDFFEEVYVQDGARKKYIRGEEHYEISDLAVDPKYQGQGIGIQLVQHCLNMAKKEVLPTWVVVNPLTHDFFSKPRFGFVDVDHRDFDLNALDGNHMRGLGIYRDWIMVLRPTNSK